MLFIYFLWEEKCENSFMKRSSKGVKGGECQKDATLLDER